MLLTFEFNAPLGAPDICVVFLRITTLSMLSTWQAQRNRQAGITKEYVIKDFSKTSLSSIRNHRVVGGYDAAKARGAPIIGGLVYSRTAGCRTVRLNNVFIQQLEWS